jgi:ABC-2 type transport system ATP-binding protein
MHERGRGRQAGPPPFSWLWCLTGIRAHGEARRQDSQSFVPNLHADMSVLPSHENVLALRGVTKIVHVGFRRRRLGILRGVDLDVAAGDVYGLLGPNGAGKTTTVKVALGLMRPSSGSVELGVPGLSHVGYMPENPYFYDYLSGREFLGFCARLFGLEAAARHDRVERLLRDVGLADAADVHLRKYSKGMLQRVGIAQALVNDPELVLLDEPMTGLDPIGRVEVKRIIEGLHERGKTVMFNSHILSDVHELCSRIAVMRAGRVIWQGTVDEALAEAATLEDFFMQVVTT